MDNRSLTITARKAGITTKFRRKTLILGPVIPNGAHAPYHGACWLWIAIADRKGSWNPGALEILPNPFYWLRMSLSSQQVTIMWQHREVDTGVVHKLANGTDTRPRLRGSLLSCIRNRGFFTRDMLDKELVFLLIGRHPSPFSSMSPLPLCCAGKDNPVDTKPAWCAAARHQWWLLAEAKEQEERGTQTSPPQQRGLD